MVLRAIIFIRKVKRRMAKVGVTPDEALRLYNEEIDRTKKELDDINRRMVGCRMQMLSTPISSELEFDRLRIFRICTEELLTCLERSRDRLVEEMMEMCL